MAYIELQDLLDEIGEDKLVELTDNEGTGEIDQKRVEKAINHAQSTFDNYARARYSIPVPVTPSVKSICLDMAVFHLYKSRASQKEGVYEIRKQANDDALKRLNDIASGKAALDVPTLQETIENLESADKILTNAARTKFTDRKLSGY